MTSFIDHLNTEIGSQVELFSFFVYKLVMSIKNNTLAQFPGLVIILQKIPSHEVGCHRHNEHEFFLPLQGEIQVIEGEKTVKAGPGRLLYVPPDVDHSFTASAQGSGERLIWLVDQKYWKKHVKQNFSVCSMPIDNLAKELLFYLLIRPKIQGSAFFVSALIESLGESLNANLIKSDQLQLVHLQGKITDERLQRVIQNINDNLSTVRLVDLAKDCGLSLRNLNRLFLKECGLSPKDFIILQRVELAKKLLKTSNLTVTDISLEVGYNSLSKFISTFKKFTGTLPSDYRRK